MLRGRPLSAPEDDGTESGRRYRSILRPAPAQPRQLRARAAWPRASWQPHTVAKRCENLRDRFARLGVPGLHGPRALEELAAFLISTGALTAEDLHRLPTTSPNP
jgi:hypothetical protein